MLEPADTTIALVLSGGNALGAFQAGACQALQEHGLDPDWVAGGSIGAINGAIVCGNPADRRVARLEEFWRPDRSSRTLGPALDEARRTAAVAGFLAGGRPGLFGPRNLLGPWWNPSGDPGPASLYGATPLIETLERLVDFDRLNAGSPRYSATAVDIETGEDVVFDTRHHRIEPLHVRASSALLPAFSPVQVGDRLLGDAGISVNLPLDSVLADPGDRPLLCIAIDLLPLKGARPRTLGDATARMQDLMFATQSRRAIAGWAAIFAERAKQGDTASATILHLPYADQAREVSGKAFDFSPESIAERWRSGHDALTAALADRQLAVGTPGLTVFTQNGPEPLQRVEWPLHPIPA